MNYEHPSIVIDQPATGHYVIYGHHPQPARNEEGQTVVPLQQCYITPEVPSDALVAILQERGGALVEPGRSTPRDAVLLAGMVGLERGGLIAGLSGEQERGAGPGDCVEGCRSAAHGDGDVALPVEAAPVPRGSGPASSSGGNDGKSAAKKHASKTTKAVAKQGGAK
jgi:hypothetical protein